MDNTAEERGWQKRRTSGTERLERIMFTERKPKLNGVLFWGIKKRIPNEKTRGSTHMRGEVWMSAAVSELFTFHFALWQHCNTFYCSIQQFVTDSFSGNKQRTNKKISVYKNGSNSAMRSHLGAQKIMLQKLLSVFGFSSNWYLLFKTETAVSTS